MNSTTPRLVSLIRFSIAIAFAFAFTNAWSATANYTGTTAGGPTWNRPVAGNPPTPPASGVGTAVRYSTQIFSVDLSGAYNFLSTSTSPAGWDNYTFLYINSFNPLAQFTNVLVGNDDNPSVGLSGFSANLNAGSTYVFVTTGFGNTDFGAFLNSITGPGNIFLNAPGAGVPESGVGIILFALVVGGLLVTRKSFATARI